jgi:hypothetical protein
VRAVSRSAPGDAETLAHAAGISAKGFGSGEEIDLTQQVIDKALALLLVGQAFEMHQMIERRARGDARLRAEVLRRIAELPS